MTRAEAEQAVAEAEQALESFWEKNPQNRTAESKLKLNRLREELEVALRELRESG